MEDKVMKLIIADEIKKTGITVQGVLIKGTKNKPTDRKFEDYKAKVIAQIKQDYTLENIKQDKILQGFRELHTSFGISNRKNNAASENLLDFVLKRGNMPSVNLLVDIYNLISVQSKLALGAHDVEHIGGNVTLRLTNGKENFHPIAYPEQKSIGAKEYAYIDDDNDVICRLEVRQCEKTKVTLDTTDVFYIIQGNLRTTENDLHIATEQLIDLTTEFCGGTAEVI
jgi:DNA/RNA-binding domain of Phe-tRNA-synthetase-like protein